MGGYSSNCEEHGFAEFVMICVCVFVYWGGSVMYTLECLGSGTEVKCRFFLHSYACIILDYFDVLSESRFNEPEIHEPEVSIARL